VADLYETFTPRKPPNPISSVQHSEDHGRNIERSRNCERSSLRDAAFLRLVRSTWIGFAVRSDLPVQVDGRVLGNCPPMDHAKRLASALNALVKSPQFSNAKARAAARQEPAVNWPATKAHNADFNPDVDGLESFLMNDGSACVWSPGQFRYVAQARR